MAKTRPRWADLADSSNESMLDSPKPALAADDSYCSQCADVENSQRGDGSLTQLMRKGITIEASPPKDFASKEFAAFIKSVSAPAERSAGTEVDSSGVASNSSGRVAPPSWQPNASAPEFVPGGQVRGSRLPSNFQPLDRVEEATPVDLSSLLERVSSTNQEPPAIAEAPTQVQNVVRRRIPRKRCPIATTAGDGKRPRAVSSANNPMKPGAFVDAAASSSSASAIAVSEAPLPEASEEDWEKRLGKRRKAVSATKATPEYLEFVAKRANGEKPCGAEAEDGTAGPPTPRTPEPEDRNVSKRRWEELVRTWRAGLRWWAGTSLDGQEVSESADA